MRYLIACFSLILVVSCSRKVQDSNDVIEDFITKIFKSESYTIQDIETFMIPEYFQKKESFSDKNLEIHTSYLKSITDDIRKDLKGNSFEYKIVKKDSFTHENYKSTLYHRTGDIFFMVSKGEPFAIFVIENGKLYAFCIDIYLSNKGNLVPYFFFDQTKL